MAFDDIKKSIREAADAVKETTIAVKETTINAGASVAMTDSEKRIAQKMGLTGANLTYFKKESEANKGLGKIFTNLENDMANTSKYDKMLTAFGTRFKAEAKLNELDTDKATILDALGKDIQKNPALGDKLEAAIRKNPDKFANRIANYREGQLAAVIAEFEAPAQTAPSGVDATVSTPAPQPTSSKANTTAAKAPVNAKPAPAAKAAPAKPDKPSIVAAAAAITSTAANDASYDAADDVIEDIIKSDGNALKNTVKNSINAPAVVSIADTMSKLAISKYGVPSATAQGFAKKIKEDSKLATAIAQNFQNNPEFVKSMAKMSKDNSPLKEPFKSVAQQEMNALMANPQKLADADYVKNLQNQMQRAEAFKESGFDKILGDMFGQFMGPLKSGLAELGLMLAGFGGQHPVLSMSKGSGFFPDIMINLQNFGRNQDEARAFSRYSPRDMTAYTPRGADGKFFHEVVSGKDANGKEIKTQVPNGQIALKTASGGEIKVIPSAGVLVAKQEAGAFDGSGKFIPGNFRVPVVTGVDEDGASSKIAMAVLTPAEFEKYKKIADAEARKGGGSIQELMVERYTAEDAHRLGKGPVVQVAKVDPVSGAVGPLTSVSAQTGQVRAPIVQAGGNRDPAANDRDYQLQG